MSFDGSKQSNSGAGSSAGSSAGSAYRRGAGLVPQSNFMPNSPRTPEKRVLETMLLYFWVNVILYSRFSR
jgi:hypothetical protein